MYVGTHYNSYYKSLFGDRGSVYGSFSKGATSKYLDSQSSGAYNTSSLKYVQDLKGGAGSLAAALKSLSSGSAYKQKTSVSSNSAALAVKSSSSSYSGQTSVKISQIASGQVNSGKGLSANGLSMAKGYQQFSIETNGRTYQFSINVGFGDSNKDMQQKMAAAINMQGIGINASVVTDSKTGLSSLSLSAQNTGLNQAASFSIQDVYGSAVAQTGADQVSQEAQNAVYSVNGGEEQSSQSNTVSIGNGLTVSLKQASEQEITISQGQDSQYAAAQVQSMVDAYNQLYGAALNNTEDSKANTLLNQLVSTARTYNSSLSKLGITFNTKGYMEVDQDKLTKAVEDGSLEKFFSGSANYGFSGQLSRIAGNVSKNPSNYVSQSTLGDNLANSFNNYSQNSFFSNYQSFFNSDNSFNSGLLFDLFL